MAAEEYSGYSLIIREALYWNPRGEGPLRKPKQRRRVYVNERVDLGLSATGRLIKRRARGRGAQNRR